MVHEDTRLTRVGSISDKWSPCLPNDRLDYRNAATASMKQA